MPAKIVNPTRKHRGAVLTSLVALIVFGIVVVAFQFNLSAIPEPGRMESYIAGKLRHTWASRDSYRDQIPPAPPNLYASVEEGDKLYGTECADCHGLDGKAPTDTGRWMYPRAANLVSPETQRYSDRELFWIVKNGIRFSGMPAFGKVETEEHIWNLVHYLRKLPSGPDAHSEPKSP
jgi:mono/diheme cytochrome c family protein